MLTIKPGCGYNPNLELPDDLVSKLEKLFRSWDLKSSRTALRVLDRMAEFDHTLDGIVEEDMVTDEEHAYEFAIICLAAGYSLAHDTGKRGAE